MSTMLRDEQGREIRRAHRRLMPAVTDNGEPSRRVEGYALLFDTVSDGLPFEETIERGALDGVLEKSDVKALLNHDIRRGLLARSRNGMGTLSLRVDDIGLNYAFDAPHTDLGNEVLENLRRGELDESSFAFFVEKETWEEVPTTDSNPWGLRHTIHKFREIVDVSPVYNAAYSSTTVGARGKEAFLSERGITLHADQASAEAAKAKAEAEARAAADAQAALEAKWASYELPNLLTIK